MNKGIPIGGAMATPIRRMLKSREYNGVVFQCGTEERAERARTAALIFRRRNDYDYKTSRTSTNLLVYKGENDPFDRRHFSVELKGDARRNDAHRH